MSIIISIGSISGSVIMVMKYYSTGFVVLISPHSVLPGKIVTTRDGARQAVTKTPALWGSGRLTCNLPKATTVV